MRILGVAFVMYVLSYIDRTNIAMAIPAMRTELGISASAIGFATGMFFWGYIILQIPAGRLASVWSAKWVILGLLLFWSLVSFSTAFVRTENQLIANRFILGLFEGGVLTCTIVLIRKWFTRAERARANTLFLISIPIASVVANPISGVVLAHFGWQMMFIVEALPGLVWALVWIWAITEEPRDARWLDPVEKARLVAALDGGGGRGRARPGPLDQDPLASRRAPAGALQLRRPDGGVGRHLLAADGAEGDRPVDHGGGLPERGALCGRRC